MAVIQDNTDLLFDQFKSIADETNLLAYPQDYALWVRVGYLLASRCGMRVDDVQLESLSWRIREWLDDEWRLVSPHTRFLQECYETYDRDKCEAQECMSEVWSQG